MSQMSDAMKRNSKRLSIRQPTKVFQNSQSVVGASRTNSQVGVRQASNVDSRVVLPAWDIELEDLPEPMRTQLQYLIDARVEKAIITTLEPHRKKVTERIDDESERTNALIKDRVTSQACRVSQQDWQRDPNQTMRSQIAKDFDENRSTMSRTSQRSPGLRGGSPGLKSMQTRSPMGRSSKLGGKQSINEDISQMSFRQSIGSLKKSFKSSKIKDAPLVANDGTLIFKHPTIRNYYEKTDKPELKDNPYNTMMNPYYMQGHPGWGPYGVPHLGGGGAGYPYGAGGGYGNIPAWNRMNTIARKMKTKRKSKYNVSKNSRLASIRDEMVSENSYRTDVSFKSAKTKQSKQSFSPNRSSPMRRDMNGPGPMLEEEMYYEDKVLPLYDPGYGSNFMGASNPYYHAQMSIYNRYGSNGGYYGQHGYYGQGGYAAHWQGLQHGATVQETMDLYSRKNGGKLSAFQQLEPTDPIYQYLDPISVCLQERVKSGGDATTVIKQPLGQLPKVCFELRVVGDEGLHNNPAALLSAEIEKQAGRYLKKKAVVKKKKQSLSPVKNAIYIGGQIGTFKEGLRETLEEKNVRAQTAKYRQGKVDRLMYSPDHSMKARLTKERDAKKKADTDSKHAMKFKFNDREAYDDPLDYNDKQSELNSQLQPMTGYMPVKERLAKASA